MSSVAYQAPPTTDVVLPQAYTNRWVRGQELPAGAFLVHGRITYGIWSHAAEAGGYKSAIASQIEHHICYGTKLPGLSWEFAQRGDCLVVTPDESIYEIQDRTLRVLPGGELPTDGTDHTPVPGIYDIHYRHVPEGNSLKERIAWLLVQIEDLEKVTGNKVVWIRFDTIGALLGEKGAADAYTHAGPLQKLNNWLASTGRVLFAPNHIGKDGKFIGSVAIAGSSNLVTETELTRESNTGVLKVSKMRGGRTWEAGLKFKNGVAEFDDLTPHQAGHKIGSMPRLVLDDLVANGPSSGDAIRERTHIDKSVFWPVMMRLRGRTEIIRTDALVWSLTDKGTATQADPTILWEEKASSGPQNMTNGTNAASTTNGSNALRQSPISILKAELRPTETATQLPADVPDNPPVPPWRARTQRKAPDVQLPEIDASWHMADGPQGQKIKVWDHSPIGVAINLIMADRDAGKLTPTWRCELPEQVTKLIKAGTDLIDGNHNAGALPRRRKGEYLAQPPGKWISYDTSGSFLASYKTHVAVKPLTRYEGEWDPKGAGLVLVRTPEWHDPRIGHPWGAGARPGELQLVWNPLMRLARQLADEKVSEDSEERVWEFPEIHEMWLRVGYMNASEAMFDGFYRRMKLARETYAPGSNESSYTKAMYSAWLSSAANGVSNVFRREDWTGSVRSEAFGPRLWGNGWAAVKKGAHLWGIGNTDELCFEPNPLLAELFPDGDTRIGKMHVKDWGPR